MVFRKENRIKQLPIEQYILGLLHKCKPLDPRLRLAFNKFNARMENAFECPDRIKNHTKTNYENNETLTVKICRR